MISAPVCSDGASAWVPAAFGGGGRGVGGGGGGGVPFCAACAALFWPYRRTLGCAAASSAGLALFRHFSGRLGALRSFWNISTPSPSMKLPASRTARTAPPADRP